MIYSDLVEVYKMIPHFQKNNLERFLIIKGIYDIYPEITVEEAELILKFCDKNMTENINPQTFSHQITDLYYKGEITKNDLEKSQNIDITKVSFFEKINHFTPINNENIEEEIDKNF